MKTFTDLEAWKQGMLLLREVYRLTKIFPAEEKFGMISQLRRASVSILANLAEGFNRKTNGDKAHKYIIARGECAEVEALLLISQELGFAAKTDTMRAIALTHSTGKLLYGLIQKFSPSPQPLP